MERISNVVESTNSGAELELPFMPTDAVLQRLSSGLTGLQAQEASTRLTRHGANRIEVRVPSSLFKELADNYLHAMAILLWITGFIAFVAHMPQLAIAIWLVNLVNGTFSFWQEFRAQKAVDALNKLLPPSVKVIRDDQQLNIPASNLVPGDIVLLEAGDRISADMRLIASQSLEVDQSTLTGESRPVRKSWQPLKKTTGGTSRTEIANLVFAGTTVAAGHGQAVVYATGTGTEFGRIAHLTQTIVDRPSPLQKEMERLTRVVSLFSVSIGIVMFFAAKLFTPASTIEVFIFALGMVVAFVPEGMVPTVTLSLALAVQRMVKRNALVKRLSSVEALGSCNIICTDKTGTLTANEMTVVKVFAGNKEYKLSGLGYSLEGELDPMPLPESGKEVFELFKAGVWCNNTRLDAPSQHQLAGDPTEVALVVAAAKAGQPVKSITARLSENAFDSRRKCMSTIHAEGQKKVAFIKGSPSHVIDRCSSEFASGQEVSIDPLRRDALLAQVNAYAMDGLRVIAAARKNLDPAQEDFSVEAVENDLCFLGLFAMYDPPRDGVVEAVEKCKRAGIQVVMITGDYEVTAEAIARKVGMIAPGAVKVITGPQLERMSEQEFVESISSATIFARVNPEHKLRIVRAFQRRGNIVAVTGDGVNDAPALKKADIGVAMGEGGSDVAKESADMILLDDNFASIVSAIEEGRAVYDNIKKFAVYVFNSNMAEAVPFIVMLMSGGLIPMPLTVMQVLSIDLGTDMVPALGLGTDPAEPGIMDRPPRSLEQPILSTALLSKALLWYGLIEAAAGMSGYFFLNWLHGWPSNPLAPVNSHVWCMATSMTLACIVCSQIGAVFCCRTNLSSIFTIDILKNRLIVAGVICEIILLALLLYVPFLNEIFNTAPLGIAALAFAASWVPIMIFMDETRKLYLRRRKQIAG